MLLEKYLTCTAHVFLLPYAESFKGTKPGRSMVVLKTPLGIATQHAINILCQCASTHNLYGNRNRHRGDVLIYSLQGVNRANAVLAIDMESPRPVSPGILHLIKKSMAPLQRGTKLTSFTEIESGVLSMLDDVVCRVMKSNETFQDFADFTSTVELGYVALMRMPQGRFPLSPF